jgi:co-chaperonin GroES (HSP10)
MIRVLGDRVLVALPPKEAETQTANGLVLVRNPDRKIQTRGVVMQLGEKSGAVDLDTIMAELDEYRQSHIGNLTDAGRMCDVVPEICKDLDLFLMARRPAPFDVQVGDVVLFPFDAGDEFELHEVRYVILREAEILAILEPKSEAA